MNSDTIVKDLTETYKRISDALQDAPDADSTSQLTNAREHVHRAIQALTSKPKRKTGVPIPTKAG